MSASEQPRPRVLVLMGGPDAEHEVSLMSGREVARALGESGRFSVESLELPRDARPTVESLAAHGADVIYPVLHGPWGEGGPLQELLETIESTQGVPFVGPGSRAARTAMDKRRTKEIARSVGVRTPRDESVVPDAPLTLAPPLVLKPSDEGSSVDLRICRTAAEVDAARASLSHRPSGLMAESFIEGREMTVGIVDGKVLPIIEIVPATAFYDYEAKYLRDDTEYRLEPGLPEATAEEMRASTRAVFEAIGLRDAARADFIVSGDEAWFLEINSAPGMTTHSLVPKAAARIGLPMPVLCASFVDRALARARPPVAH